MVQFLVEDERGNVAPVHLYHLPARLEPEELNAMYPLGAAHGELPTRPASKGPAHSPL